MKDEKHAGGRPRKVKSPEVMQDAFDDYFARQDEEKRPYTVPGLAISVGLTRTGLWKYGDEYPEFVDTLSRAKLRIEEQRCEGLVTTGSQVQGIKFDLQNNYSWSEKREIELDATVKVKEEDLNERIAAIATDDEGE